MANESAAESTTSRSAILIGNKQYLLSNILGVRKPRSAVGDRNNGTKHLKGGDHEWIKMLSFLTDDDLIVRMHSSSSLFPPAVLSHENCSSSRYNLPSDIGLCITRCEKLADHALAVFPTMGYRFSKNEYQSSRVLRSFSFRSL